MSQQLRLEARKLQNGKTALTFFIAVIQLALIFLPSAAAIFADRIIVNKNSFVIFLKAVLFTLLAILTAVIYCLLKGASDKYFLKKAQAKDDCNRKSYYHCLKPMSLKGEISLRLLLFFSKLMCFCLCFAPSGTVAIMLYKFISGENSLYVAAVIFSGLAVMTLLGIAYYLKINRMYFLCAYLFFSGYSESPLQCMKKSVRLMKNNELRLFRLKLSFTGWFMLCAFVLPFSYVWGYYRQTLALFAEKIIENAVENKSIKE